MFGALQFQASHGMHKGSPEARRRMCACRCESLLCACRCESLLHACSGQFRACDGRVVAPQLKRRKKAMMRMRLDVFVGAQPEEEQEAGFHSGSQAWGRQPAWAQPQVTGPCTMQATPDGTMHRSSRIPAPDHLAPESGPRIRTCDRSGEGHARCISLHACSTRALSGLKSAPTCQLSTTSPDHSKGRKSNLFCSRWLQDDCFLPPPAFAAEAAGLATAAFPSLQQAAQGGGQLEGQAMIILAALRQLQQGETLCRV